jgi:hypothetical protein
MASDPFNLPGTAAIASASWIWCDADTARRNLIAFESHSIGPVETITSFISARAGLPIGAERRRRPLLHVDGVKREAETFPPRRGTYVGCELKPERHELRSMAET